MPAGRPPLEFTKEMIAKVEQLAAQGLTQEQICQVLGIHVATMCKKKKEIAELNEAIKNGRAKGIGKVTNKLFQKAMEGDNTAIIFYLKNRDRENWQDVNKVEQKMEADINVGRISEAKRKKMVEEMKEKIRNEQLKGD